jgi:hypothetical protein
MVPPELFRASLPDQHATADVAVPPLAASGASARDAPTPKERVPPFVGAIGERARGLV